MAPLQPVPDSRPPWLAMGLGCCASRRDSVDSADLEAAIIKTQAVKVQHDMQICYEQPQAIPQPHASPIFPRAPDGNVSRRVSQWVAAGRDITRASVHTISKPRKSIHKSRLTISKPTDLQHTDGLNVTDDIQAMLDDAPVPVRRRRSFRPLQLSIYQTDNRLSPLPDFLESEWDESLAMLQFPAQACCRERDSLIDTMSSFSDSYLIQRKPVGSGLSARSSMQSQRPIQPRALSATLIALPPLVDNHSDHPLPVVGAKSAPPADQGSPHRPSSSRSRPRFSSPSPSRSRRSTVASQPGGLRRAKSDVDEAIRELNTIVEERRATRYTFQGQDSLPDHAYQPPLSPSHHVPALAPSLRMHVRSQTLSDIGSAFSMPLANKALPNLPNPSLSSDSRPLSRASTAYTLRAPSRVGPGPLNSNPLTPPLPASPTTSIRRLGAWLKRTLPTTPNSSTSVPITSSPLASPFYHCPPDVTADYSSGLSSRQSSVGSRTLVHTRQGSSDTTATSIPPTPALTDRSLSMTSQTSSLASKRVVVLKGSGKVRRIPAPLNLSKEKEMFVEAPLASARSIASNMSGRTINPRPPMSPNYGILHGMEVAVRPANAGVVDRMSLNQSPSPALPVGVAF